MLRILTLFCMVAASMALMPTAGNAIVSRSAVSASSIAMFSGGKSSAPKKKVAKKAAKKVVKKVAKKAAPKKAPAKRSGKVNPALFSSGIDPKIISKLENDRKKVCALRVAW